MNLKKKILALLGSVVLIVGSVSVYCYVEKSVTKIESTEKESHKKTSKDKTSDSSTNSSSKKNTTSNSKTSLNKSNNESTNTTENTSEVLENQEIVEPEVTSEPPIEVPQKKSMFQSHIIHRQNMLVHTQLQLIHGQGIQWQMENILMWDV